jgi:hypothetical protein
MIRGIISKRRLYIITYIYIHTYTEVVKDFASGIHGKKIYKTLQEEGL